MHEPAEQKTEEIADQLFRGHYTRYFEKFVHFLTKHAVQGAMNVGQLEAIRAAFEKHYGISIRNPIDDVIIEEPSLPARQPLGETLRGEEDQEPE